MKLLIILALIAVAALLAAQTVAYARTYQEGQVWTYRARPGDEQSLLKIQKVEQDPELGTIHHISIIGFRLKNPVVAPIIAHTPVSKASLDASVLALTKDAPSFPSAEDGIEEWRNADDGRGVFTIPVAEIVQLLDESSSRSSDR